MYIEQLYTNCLAEAAYYIESEGEAAVIDPLRETEPYIALAKKRGAAIKYVFETHFHADFVSGHIDLAKKANASIVYGPNANANYDVINAVDDQEFKLGKVKLKALHTPGHTPESTCYLLIDERGEYHAVFTGDTLFVGDVGRPDLLDGIISREDLASMMYDSLNKKIKVLPDAVIVYPGHGPGSACGKNIGKETLSTIGEQKRFNYALQDMSRDEFIKKVTDGILPPPHYFFDDARINKMGYTPIEEVIKTNTKALTFAEFKNEIEKGAWILDTRDPDAFGKGFIHGSINIGLNGQYAVWVGTLLDIDQPLVLITETGKEEEAVLRLARVGYEKVVGYLEGGIPSWEGALDTIKTITAEEMKVMIHKGVEVLDVRKPGEWNVSRLRNATFLSLSDILENHLTLDKRNPYLIHCAGGYRSMIAISVLKRQGFKGELYNIQGGFSAMQQAGLPVVTDGVSV